VRDDAAAPTDVVTAAEADAPRHEPGEDEPRFLPGDRVTRYVILSSLGKGGMSVVYLAYDPELDRKVALKLMRVTMLGEKGRLRLQREAQALAKLSHPNVVPVFDAGAIGDQAFVAMEYVEGKTLRRWLRDPHDWREALRVMLDAGRGLAAAHAAGLVHRDFKPDNVLLGADGRARVADFGLARLASVLDGTAPPSQPSSVDDEPPSEVVPLVPSSKPAFEEVTRADQLVGTPAYMAPEQMRRERADERSDQYAFCVTLYEALYGKRAFDPPTGPVGSAASTADLSTVTAKRVLRPPPRATKVPSFVQRAVARGLSEDPSERFASLDQLLRALTDDPRVRWRRAAAGVAVAAVLAVSAGGAIDAQRAARAMCHAGRDIDAVWGPAQRAEVARAFAATGAPYADTATRSLTKALDDYATKWAAMDDDACAAARLRGEQSTEVLDLRMACLSDRRKELAALVDVVRHADVDTVQQASRATQSLGPIDECADIAALRAPTPRPRDPAAARAIDDLQRRLAIVEANYAVGKSAEAAKLAEALLEEAKATGFGPLVADVAYWRARSYADQGDSDRSIPAFREAFAFALGSRSERTLRWAAARLAQEYIYATDHASYEYWAEIAEQALARSGPDTEHEDFVAHLRCVAMWATGGLQSRLACLEKYGAKVERTRPLNAWELVTVGLAASDAGELARGVEYLRRGYDASLKENGPTHPRTLEMRGYLCKGLIDYGDFDAAYHECDEAVRQAEAAGADNAKLVGKIRMYLGVTLRETKRYDEARKQLEVALANAPERDDVLMEIAELDAAEGRRGEARKLLEKSLEEAEKTLPPEHANVIASMMSLGEQELDDGATAEARALLDRAAAKGEHAELSDIMRAELDFDEARALYATAPADRPRAIDLAKRARDEYTRGAPPTKRWTDEENRIDRWLADAGQGEER
jgi:tetratricopeptide (TPR) repeat protein/predicted Ser/Thr protein kinase